MTINEKLYRAKEIIPRKGSESYEVYFRKNYFRYLYARMLYLSALHDLKEKQREKGLSSSELLLRAEIFELLHNNANRRYHFPEEQRYSNLARKAYEEYFAAGGASCRAYHQYLTLLRFNLKDEEGIFRTTDYLLKQDDDLKMVAHYHLKDDWLVGYGSFTRENAREHWEAFKQRALRTEENGRCIYRLQIGDFDAFVNLEAGSDLFDETKEPD